MKADLNGAEDVSKWETNKKYHVDDDHETGFMATLQSHN
jgi:hypothetical protein